MQLKLDVKTLVVGIFLGAVLVSVIGAGAGSADADRFGIAVASSGSAIVKTQDGSLYVVNVTTGMAIPILQSRSLNISPRDNRDYRSPIFNLNVATKTAPTR